MKKFALVFPLLLWCILTLSAFHTLQNGYKTINQSTYSLTYPTPWKVYFKEASNKGFTLSRSNGKWSNNITLDVHPIPKERHIPFNWGDFESFPKDTSRSSAIDSTETTFISMDTTAMFWNRRYVKEVYTKRDTFSEGLHQRRGYLRLLRIYQKENRRYYLSFSTKQESFEQLKPEVTQIFDSFRVK
jgi:hypothetical protein